jgi:choline transport protein
LTCITLVIGVFACVAVMTTNSCHLFAFARDSGVPFSKSPSQVSHVYQTQRGQASNTATSLRFRVPLLIFLLLLSLISLGFAIAFQQVLALRISAMLTTYMISISCAALKRVRGQPLLPSTFSLGRWGLPLNIVVVLFLFFLRIFAYFPTVPSPAPADTNWAILGYGSVIMVALVYYVFRGRHRYVGPVEYVRKRQ